MVKRDIDPTVPYNFQHIPIRRDVKHIPIYCDIGHTPIFRDIGYISICCASPDDISSHLHSPYLPVSSVPDPSDGFDESGLAEPLDA